MSETSLLAAFLKYARKRIGSNGLILRHVDAMTRGAPDVSMTVCGGTCWLEGKFVHSLGRMEHIRLDIRKRAIQHYNMKLLANAGTAAYYLVWTDIDGHHRTLLVHPSQVQDDGKTQFIAGMTLGHDHEWAFDFICQRISARVHV